MKKNMGLLQAKKWCFGEGLPGIGREILGGIEWISHRKEWCLHGVIL